MVVKPWEFSQDHVHKTLSCSCSDFSVLHQTESSAELKTMEFSQNHFYPTLEFFQLFKLSVLHHRNYDPQGNCTPFRKFLFLAFKINRTTERMPISEHENCHKIFTIFRTLQCTIDKRFSKTFHNGSSTINFIKFLCIKTQHEVIGWRVCIKREYTLRSMLSNTACML